MGRQFGHGEFGLSRTWVRKMRETYRRLPQGVKHDALSVVLPGTPLGGICAGIAPVLYSLALIGVGINVQAE